MFSSSVRQSLGQLPALRRTVVSHYAVPHVRVARIQAGAPGMQTSGCVRRSAGGAKQCKIEQSVRLCARCSTSKAFARAHGDGQARCGSARIRKCARRCPIRTPQTKSKIRCCDGRPTRNTLPISLGGGEGLSSCTSPVRQSTGWCKLWRF